VRHAADDGILVRCLASNGNSSPIITPSTLGGNGFVERPAIIVTAAGLGSNVSRCAGPPHIQIWITDFARAPRAAAGCGCSSHWQQETRGTKETTAIASRRVSGRPRTPCDPRRFASEWPCDERACWIHNGVAQSCTLLYRRFVIGRARLFHARDEFGDLQNAILRYSRWKSGATSLVISPRCLKVVCINVSGDIETRAVDQRPCEVDDDVASVRRCFA